LHQLARIFMHARDIAAGPAPLDLQVPSLSPSQFRKSLPKCNNARLRHRVVLADTHEHTEAPHALCLLRARRERPRRRRAAYSRDKLSPPHSITSSARARIESGMVTPSVLAILRSTIRSNLVGCWTGRSEGLAPLRILST